MLYLKRGTDGEYLSADVTEYIKDPKEAFNQTFIHEVVSAHNPKSVPEHRKPEVVLTVPTCWSNVTVVLGTVVLVLGLFYMSRSMHSLWGLLMLSLVNDSPNIVLTVKPERGSK